MNPKVITTGLRQAATTADLAAQEVDEARRLFAQHDTETRAEAWNILMAHAENAPRKQRAELANLLDQASLITPNLRARALLRRTACRLDATLVDRP